MTNILKDVWEDHSRGVCWLPQEVFTRHGIDLATLTPGPDARFDAGMRELIGVAHAHLRNALAYTLLIPRRETGIRRFCLWAVGLAVLTLRRIERTPGFTSGAQVKVSRSTVTTVTLLTGAAVRHDWVLQASVRSGDRRPDRGAALRRCTSRRSGCAAGRAALTRSGALEEPAALRPGPRPSTNRRSRAGLLCGARRVARAAARRGSLAVRARGGLHHTGRIHLDAAFPRRTRSRRWRPGSPRICARIRPGTAAGGSITAANSTSAAASRPTSP